MTALRGGQVALLVPPGPCFCFRWPQLRRGANAVRGANLDALTSEEFVFHGCAGTRSTCPALRDIPTYTSTAETRNFQQNLPECKQNYTTYIKPFQIKMTQICNQ